MTISIKHTHTHTHVYIYIYARVLISANNIALIKLLYLISLLLFCYLIMMTAVNDSS